jgi:hypothetical protein
MISSSTFFDLRIRSAIFAGWPAFSFSQGVTLPDDDGSRKSCWRFCRQNLPLRLKYPQSPALSSRESIMTPRDFLDKMSQIASSESPPADKRIEGETLIVELLRQLGYATGADKFAEMVKILA